MASKNRMNQANVWRKNVGMSIHLLSIAFIYLVVWIPQCIFFIMIGLGTPYMQALAGEIAYEYTGNFTSFTIVLCPFIALASLSQVLQKMKQDLARLLGIQNAVGHNRIVPIVDNKRIGPNNPKI